jgi:hypothetical protein
MKNIFRSLLLLCSLLLAGNLAQAQLVLNVDTTNQYIWFTGSLIGTSGPYSTTDTSGGGFAFWTNQGNKNVGDLMLYEGGWGSFYPISGFTSSSPEFIGVRFGSRPDSGLQMFVLFFDTSTQGVSMTINGGGLDNKMSYASGALGGATNEIEGMIGTSMVYWHWNTGGSVSVQAASISTVPEPSTYAAIFGAIALIGTIAVRKRAKQN